MKLHTSRRAPNPRRVAWILAEKGITDVEVVEVDLMRGEHRAPDYLARTGWAATPALELDDGTTITESLAIGRYLEALHPEPNLFGRGPRETAVVEMWTRRAELAVANPLMLMVQHTHPALAAQAGEQVPAFAARHRADAEAALAAFDRRLADSAWIAGERLTAADIVLYTGIDFGRMVQHRPAAGLGDLARWMADMRARPAAAAGM